MFEKLGLFYNVFRQGQAVADAVKLKNKQMLGNLIAVLLGSVFSIGKLYGYDFHISPDDLTHIGAVAAIGFGLFNSAATVASSDKIGLPAKPEQNSASNTVSGTPVPILPEPPAPEPVQPDPHTAARVGEQFVDSDNPLAGLDTTYRG
ncbi:hypothetical protein ACO0K9_12235 [Undibacterium sp. Ji50W]|uniref:hypothetical protein n=1 Tax=Undibacterium sp. Ji50W TaxID=3413041 RepID=UPI003BF0009D